MRTLALCIFMLVPEFGHGITPRLSDEVNEKLGNQYLLTTLDKSTTSITRQHRISLAIWSPE